MRRKEKSLIMH